MPPKKQPLTLFPTFLTSRGYAIEKAGNDALIEEITSTLMVKPKVNPNAPGADQVEAFPVYRENSKKLYMPRHYGLSRFGAPMHDQLPDGDDAPGLVFDGGLRLEQQPVVDAYLDAARDPHRGGGIIVLQCGGGKTVTALYLASQIGKKTLVVCHKEFLMNQWKERIAQFLPGASVGRIQQKLVDVQGRDIVLGSLQSLAMREYDPEMLARFGMVIYDECFPYDQCVVTEAGPVPIGDLYARWQRHHGPSLALPLPKVLSYDEHHHVFAWKPITFAWEKRTDRLYTLSIEGPTEARIRVQCTPRHRFLTATKGWQEAHVLRVGDALMFYDPITQRPAQSRILGIKDSSCDRAATPVYDLEVADHHTFVVCAPTGPVAGPVVHNCHHLGAEVFSRAMMKTPARVTLGLSATLARKDGLTKVIEWHLGSPVHVATKRTDTQLVVHMHGFYDPHPDYGREQKLWNGKVNSVQMINSICSFGPRNDLILTLLSNLLEKEPGRKVMILSARRNHLTKLERMVREAGLGTTGFYVGGMKEDALKESETKDVLFATAVMAAEGLDVPALNTLILASPMGDVEQAVGRIQRQKPHERKYVPLVIDVWDQFSIFMGQGKKRAAFYTKNGYQILRNGKDPEPDAATRENNARSESGAPSNNTYEFLEEDSSEDES